MMMIAVPQDSQLPISNSDSVNNTDDEGPVNS